MLTFFYVLSCLIRFTHNAERFALVVDMDFVDNIVELCFFTVQTEGTSDLQINANLKL